MIFTKSDREADPGRRGQETEAPERIMHAGSDDDQMGTAGALQFKIFYNSDFQTVLSFHTF